jgi:ABC-2 type transport system permease protein
MSQFLSFVKKEFQHILRDKKTLLVLFGIPLMQVLIFGYVITNDFQNIGISVMDQARDQKSEVLINRIFSSGYFINKGEVHNLEEISSKFKSGKVKAILVIEPSFGGNLKGRDNAKVQIITDASDPNLANTIVNYLSGIIRNFAKDEIPYAQSKGIVAETRMVYNEQMEGAYMFVPGTIALILMLISALLTSISVTREKEQGTMEVLLVSPLKPGLIIMSKVIPYVFLAFVNGIVILIMSYFVFGVPVNGSLLLLLLAILLYITLALSIGVFFSTIAKTQQVAMFLSLFALMLPTILLSGFIFPIENMPIPLQLISHIMPPKWFIMILKDIMLKGNGIAYIWDEGLILIGMTAFFLLVSIRKFNTRLES